MAESVGSALAAVLAAVRTEWENGNLDTDVLDRIEDAFPAEAETAVAVGSTLTEDDAEAMVEFVGTYETGEQAAAGLRVFLRVFLDADRAARLTAEGVSE